MLLLKNDQMQLLNIRMKLNLVLQINLLVVPVKKKLTKEILYNNLKIAKEFVF